MNRLLTLALSTTALLALAAADAHAQVRRSQPRSVQRGSVQRSVPRPVQRSAPRPVQRAQPRVQRSVPRAQPRVQRSAPRTVQRSIPQTRTAPQRVQRSTPQRVQRSTPQTTRTQRYGVSSNNNLSRRSVQTQPRSTPSRVTTPRSSSNSRVRTPSSSSRTQRLNTTPQRSNSRAYSSGVSQPRTRLNTRTPSSTRVTPSTPTRRYSTTETRSTPVKPAKIRYRSSQTTRLKGDSVRRAVGGSVKSKSSSSRLRVLHDRATNRAKASRIQTRVKKSYDKATAPNTRRVRAGSPTLRNRTPRATVNSPSAVASTRYPVAGRLTARPSATAVQPRATLTTRSPALRGGKQVTPTLGRTLSRSIHSVTSSSAAILSSRRNVYGHTHWGNHYSTLSFAFGIGGFSRWGCYSYPYHYAASLPSYYNHCWSSYGYYGSRIGFGFNTCWWPRWSRCWSTPLFASWNSYDLYYDAGPSYVVVRDSSPSVKVASAAGESLADVVTRHLTLGDFYFKEGRFDDAAESYFRALAYAPDDGSLHFVIADALFAQGDYHFAAHMIRKGVELDPLLVLAETDKREFYGDPKLFDEQMETLRGYLGEKPYDAAAHVVLGYNLWFSGDRDVAETSFERVREIDPGNSTAAAFLEAASPESAPASVEDSAK